MSYLLLEDGSGALTEDSPAATALRLDPYRTAEAGALPGVVTVAVVRAVPPPAEQYAVHSTQYAVKRPAVHAGRLTTDPPILLDPHGTAGIALPGAFTLNPQATLAVGRS
jgi:hypothetical protein